MVENRKCPFCGKEMICVNTQDGEFTCTSCAEYANHDVLDFIEKLQAENERLKGENEKIKAESQKAFDVLTESVKAVCKENAKLKCLALHAIRDLFDYKGHKLNYEGKEIWKKYCHKYIEFDKAYRKAKNEMMEGK